MNNKKEIEHKLTVGLVIVCILMTTVPFIATVLIAIATECGWLDVFLR